MDESNLDEQQRQNTETRSTVERVAKAIASVMNGPVTHVTELQAKAAIRAIGAVDADTKRLDWLFKPVNRPVWIVNDLRGWIKIPNRKFIDAAMKENPTHRTRRKRG